MPKKKSAKKPTPTPKYDSQRETKVLLEHIRSEVKSVAEGHGILNQKLDNVNAKLQEHDTRFDRLEMVATVHSNDIKELKSGQKRLEAGQEELKTGQEEMKLEIKELKVGQKRLEIGQEEIKQKLDTVTTNHEQRIQKLEAVR